MNITKINDGLNGSSGMKAVKNRAEENQKDVFNAVLSLSNLAMQGSVMAGSGSRAEKDTSLSDIAAKTPQVRTSGADDYSRKFSSDDSVKSSNVNLQADTKAGQVLRSASADSSDKVSSADKRTKKSENKADNADKSKALRKASDPDNTRDIKKTGRADRSDDDGLKAVNNAASVAEPSNGTITDKSLEELKETICEVLSIDPEQLEDLLNQLNLKLTDLIVPDNLKALMMKADTSLDISSFITDENVHNEFMVLEQSISDIIAADAGVIAENDGLTGNQNSPAEDTNNALMAADNNNSEEVIQDAVKASDEQGGVHSDADDIVNGRTDDLKQASGGAKDTEPLKAVSVTVRDERTLKGQAQNALSAADPLDASESSVQEILTNADQSGKGGSNSAGSGFLQQQGQGNAPKDTNAQEQLNPEGIFANARNNGTVTDNIFRSVMETKEVRSSNIREMISIVNQVTGDIRLHLSDSMTSMQMQLNPERLGHVLLHLTSRNGVMTAQFTVENQAAKDALESQMIRLQQTFDEKNIQVTDIEVTVSNMSFTDQNSSGQNMNSDQGDGRERRYRFREDAGIEDNAADPTGGSTQPKINDLGGSVDYIA
ncbi:MAG: flagellar hook-length control protein FliK [Lachnospiraceae bacterium]|jgi:flagellar hook-length control protein FliK|nr:flagellar hook-length control protein FliK [Lachnospiraceae bacterium]MEE3460451.1 flagellar hook-length control protein FliK [Lachnospiraceae bacterium]